MRSRVDQLGVSEPQIAKVGKDLIDVQLPNVTDTARAKAEVGNTAGLYFYDWEANALTPNGKTVASQLLAQDTTATELSQGVGAPRPGRRASAAPACTARSSSRCRSRRRSARSGR